MGELSTIDNENGYITVAIESLLGCYLGRVGSGRVRQGVGWVGLGNYLYRSARVLGLGPVFRNRVGLPAGTQLDLR